MRAGFGGLLVVMAVAACGPAVGRAGLSAPSPEVAAERRRLGPLVGDGTGAQEQRRLIRVADLERRLGNRDQAVHATGLALDKARVEAATASGAERAAAEERLARARSRAIELGHTLEAPLLVISATRDAAPGTDAADALAAAVRRVSWVDDEQRAAIVRLGRDEVALLAHVERGSYGKPLASLEQLSSLGASAADLISDRLAAAIARRDLEAIAAASAALIEADALSLLGRLARLYLADRAANRLSQEPLLMDDVLIRTPDPAGFARLERLRERHPESTALVAALAYRYINSELHGDAHALLRSLDGADWIDPEAGEVLDALSAIAAFAAGDLAGYRAWAEAAGASDSPLYTALEASYWDDDAPALRLAARVALRRGRQRGFPGLGMPRWRRALLVATDPDAPAGERRAALAELRSSSWREAAVAERCITRRLPAPACDALVEAQALLESGGGTAEELGAALDRLVAVEGFTAEWLWIASEQQAPAVAALRPGIERLAGTRIALTEPYVYARVMAALAADDVDAAAGHATTGAEFLTAASRLGLELGIADARAGVPVETIINQLYSPSWPPERLEAIAAADEAPAELEAQVPGSARTARMARALEAWRRGWARTAASELGALLAEPDIAERGPLAGLAALAARAADDHEAADRALAILAQEAPDSPAHALVAAELAAAEGRWSDALPHYARAARAWPRDSLPADGYLRALVNVHPGKQGARRGRAFIAASAASSVNWLRPLYTDGTIEDGATLARYLEARHDGAVAATLDPRAATLAPIASTAAAWFDREIAGAPTAGNAAAIAGRAAAFLRRADPPVGARATIAWLLFLSGRGQAGAWVAIDPDWDRHEPLSAWELVVVMGADRDGQAPAIDDELALGLWRHLRLGEGDPVALAESLLARRDQVASADRVACRLLIDASLADRAIAPCARAWRDLERGLDADLAAAVTWLLLQRPAEIAGAGLAPEDIFTRARFEVPIEDSQVWTSNEALYREREGDWQRASDAWQRAVESGHQLAAADPEPEALPELARRGTTMRYAAARTWSDNGWARLLDLARLSLYGGEVTAAGWYLTAAAARPVDASDETVAIWRSVIGSAYDLAAADVAAGHIDQAGVRRWMLGSESPTPATARELAARYPDAVLGRAAILTSLEDETPTEESVALARELAGAFPHNPMVIAVAAHVLARSGDVDTARSLLETALSAHPDDALLALVSLPGGDGNWLQDPDRLEAQVAAAAASGFADTAPHRLVPDDREYEVFVPGGGLFDGSRYVGQDDLRILVRVLDAPACPGEYCMDATLKGMAKSGAIEKWRAVRDGRYLALVELKGTHMVIELSAFGDRTLMIISAGSAEGLTQQASAIALARQTLRPLDQVLSAADAEAVRHSLSQMPADTLRLDARLELDAHTGGGCPIARALARVTGDAARNALLVDVALRAPGKVASLLECPRGAGGNLGALLLVAGLSGEPTARAIARSLAAEHPDELARAARALTGSAGDRPAYGWLQVLELLPPEPARALWDELFRSTDDGAKAAAIAASMEAPERADLELLRGEIRSGPARWARPAAMAASMRGADAADLDAMRSRLDALTAPLDDGELELLRILPELVASHLDARDRARLQRAVRLAPDTDESLQRRLQRVRDAHTLGRGGRAAGGAPVRAMLERWRASTGGAGDPDDEPVSASLLASATLPELLSGTGWSYARLGSPGAIVEAAPGFGSQLPVGLWRRVNRSLFGTLSTSIVSDGSGIDRTRPIECAVRGSAHDSFVCTAYVLDADAVRATIDDRTYGEDSGLALALRLATDAGAALAAELGLLDQDEEIYGRSAASELLVNERAWRSLEIGGHPVEQHFIAWLTNSWLGIDTEEYLFAGDRLFVFSNRALTREVLTDAPAPGRSLAAEPVVAAILQRPAGARLDARLLRAAPADIAGPIAVSVTLTEAGIHYAAGEETEQSAAALARLPAGAPIIIRSSVPWPEATASAGEDEAPPRWLAGGAFAIAWVENGQWVAVAPLDKRAHRELRGAGVRLDGARPVGHGDRFYARTGDWLVIASDEALVTAALR